MTQIKRNIPEDYLSGAETLREFYQFSIQNPDLKALIEGKAKENQDRDTLVSVLLEQHKDLPNNELTQRHIELLRQPNTFTLTTGHQLVLGGGPMFMLYKIATAIRMAESLRERFPDYNFVPVFWMATEDHDWDEANHYYTDYCDPIRYSPDYEGAVGRHILTPEIQEVLPETHPYRLAFEPGMKYADAYRRFAHQLFGDKGLIILDADHAALKRLFIPQMEQDLFSHSPQNLIQQTNSALESKGYKTQVFPREINLFYLGDGFRDRIVELENGFGCAEHEKSWTKEELKTELHANPEKFSPNVALRPLYQEVILPNLAYTGGWGELSYWLQFKGLFDHFGVQFPLLMPRFTAGILTKAQSEKAAAFHFAPQDFDLHLHRLYEKYIPHIWDEGPFEAQRVQIETAMAGLQKMLAEMDPTLGKSWAGEIAKLAKRLDRIKKKVHKSLRNKHSRVFREIKELKTEVQPSGSVQERVLNFTTFDIEPAALLNLIYQHCHPFEPYQKKWILLP